MDLPAYLIQLMKARSIRGRVLARRLDVDPTFVSQVRLRKRLIPPAAISDWIKALQLTGKEADEFRALALVQYGPPELRSYVMDLRRKLAERKS